MRHFVVTVLVVVLVNTQLTWWIIFVLRQNRTLLDLERRRVTDAGKLEAARVRTELDQARWTLERWLVATDWFAGEGAWPPPDPPPPFDRGVAPPETLAGVPGWHLADGGRLRLEIHCLESICGFLTGEGWAQTVLEPQDGLEVVSVDDIFEAGDLRPVSALPAPFVDLVVRPDETTWNEILEGYRTRILMMVSEGAFFAVVLFVLIGLLWRTLRRELELQRQHRNFLSAITHELKSPLAATRLALETVMLGRADEAATARFLNNALLDTERLQDLVQKVLETTRYGQGGRLEIRRVCVSEVVSAAVEAVRPRVEVLGGEIVADVIPGCYAGAEEEAFRIVVSNLLDNAVKYGGSSPRIGVRLDVKSDWAVLEVSDNGGGIPEDDVPLVFERFYRAGDELSRTTRGTGLGLYLVQQIIRAHRGTVEITTTGPDGTTFRVEIPGAELKESGP